MKYKLLNFRGIHLVCLEDNTRIPLQVNATTQKFKDPCVVMVEALLDERLGAPEDPKLRLSEGVLTFGDYELDNISDVEIKPGDKENMGRIFFTVECELPDTVVQPKPAIHD